MKLDEQLFGVSIVAIAGHIRPDGDCAGSCLAVYNYITKNFPHIEVDIYLEIIPKKYSFLTGSEKINSDFDKDIIYDLFIALDCGDVSRLGEAERYFKSAKNTICIDHHISNTGYAKENYIVPEASSTCELVFLVLDEKKIDKNIAESLYVGIIHDTGVFQYSCTSGLTMQIAGKLMGKGIEFTKIIEETYYQKTYAQNQILGRALLESMYFLDGQGIFTAVKKSTMDFYSVEPKDLDGIVNQLIAIKGVACAIFLYEEKAHEYKVSMRSGEKVDVSKIALHFGGGGHVRAAGCMMTGTIHDVINNLSIHIQKQLFESCP